MDDEECVITEDFLQAVIDYMQMRKEECETLLARVRKMKNQTNEIDDTIVQSIKDGRITPKMASLWIRAKRH